MVRKDTYLTQDELQRLAGGLHQVRTVRRIQVTERLHGAKANTDSAENSGNERGMNEQAWVEGRIPELEASLNNLVIIREGHAERGIISISARFTVRDQDGGQDPCALVGTAETDASYGRMPHESPVGSAVIVHTTGAHAEVAVPHVTRFHAIVHVD